MAEISIRSIKKEDKADLKQFIQGFWGSEKMVSRGKLHDISEHAGFLAKKDGKIIGLVTYEKSGEEMEITLLDSRERNRGIGSKLVDKIKVKARELNCRRIWLITTNDNIIAIKFYQKRDFDLVRLHYNSMEASRKLKPEIPKFGQEGIPIKHELEFEYKVSYF